MAAIDLNADLGETVAGVPTADDEAMFAVISSASIACGGHAGDAASMRDAVARAARFGVAVGRASVLPRSRELRAPVHGPRCRGADAGDRPPARGAPQGRRRHPLRQAARRALQPHRARMPRRRSRSPTPSSTLDALGRPVPVLGLGGAIAAAASAARSAVRDRGVPRPRVPRRTALSCRATSRARFSTTRGRRRPRAAPCPRGT